MKRLTIRASRQRHTVRFGVEAYRSRTTFLLHLTFWPLAITLRVGGQPQEIHSLGGYDAA